MRIGKNFRNDGIDNRFRAHIKGKDIEAFIKLFNAIRKEVGSIKDAAESISMSHYTAEDLLHNKILTKEAGKKILDGYNKLKAEQK